MPRKTLALISGLVLVTVVLFIVAFRAGKQQTSVVPTPTPLATNPSPAVPAHTSLTMVPSTLSVAPGQQGKVDVTIDTMDNSVTAVQLELQYDPTVVSNVQVSSGPLFPNPVVLINKNDPKTGRVTYAFGILPNHQTVQGTGSIATVTFTAARTANGKQAEITLLPSTLVTARGIAESVLKPEAMPAKASVTIGSGTGATTQTTAPSAVIPQ